MPDPSGVEPVGEPVRGGVVGMESARLEVRCPQVLRVVIHVSRLLLRIDYFPRRCPAQRPKNSTAVLLPVRSLTCRTTEGGILEVPIFPLNYSPKSRFCFIHYAALGALDIDIQVIMLIIHDMT